MRLTLVIPSLECGGAERVMCALANAWAERGHDVTVLTMNREGSPAFFLQPSVKRRQLDLPAEPANFVVSASRQLFRIRALRRSFRELKPDLIISFLTHANILTLLAARRLAIPVIVSERADPSMYKIGFLWESLRRMTYPWARMLVCQTQSSLRWFQRHYGLKGCVIPNPVGAPFCEQRDAASRNSDNGFTVFAVGRLSHEKGFDLLLRAFARVVERHPDWSLKVIGDGPLRSELIADSHQMQLEKRVEFLGAVADPFPLLRSADLFVLPSRFEGFPNALCEAMALGVAPISFDCPSGPAEIIRDGVDGVLVPPQDVDALASAMDSLMTDSALRQSLASRAPEVISRFSLPKILLLWEDVFEKAHHPASTVRKNELRGEEARLQSDSLRQR